MATDLGKCVAEYKTSASGFGKVVAIMFACAVVACGLLYLAILSGDSNIGGRVIMFILGLLFLLPVGLAAHGLTKGRKNAVRVHERGIAVHKAGIDTEVPFDDIASYSTGAFLVIETKAEDVVDFALDGLANVPDLFSRLREEVIVKRLVPGFMNAIAVGEAITFDDDEIDAIAPEERDDTDTGGFVLDAKGVKLVTSERHLAWSDITECGATEKTSSVGKGMLTVSSVFVKTKSETFNAVIEPFSDREAMVAVCKELIAKASH
jgi:hypothetical protein